jgi:uncharacterized oxidoreductase
VQVRDKHVIITGGTSGIGLELARQLRDHKAMITIVGRHPEKLAREEGLDSVAADLSNAEGCEAVIGAMRGKPLDILINNAGVDPAYTIGNFIDSDAMDRAIFLNLAAPIRLISGLIAELKARPEAAIVNVTSGYAIVPSASTPVYCATKAGLRSFTLALRHQLRDTRVAVLEALPALVDTPMTADVPGTSKMSPLDCAAAIVGAILKGRDEANIGQVNLLRAIYSVSPAFARRMVIAS